MSAPHADVQGAPLPGPALRLASPTRDPGPGFVVVLAGGGYRIRAEHEAGPVADWLAGCGIRAGVLDYTVDPSPYPVALRELLAALADVRRGRYGHVEGPVGVLGFSAGGHLAGLAATATAAELLPGQTRPDAAVLCYPVVSMITEPHRGSRDSLLDGVAAPEVGCTARALSVDLRVDAATPPVFVWHTADDDTVPVSHSLGLAAAIRAAGGDIDLHVLPHGRHGLGLEQPSGTSFDWRKACLEWLAGRGFGRDGHLVAV